ncbi:unnamed protein product [Prunus armeniaca]|uniref:Uncharacterized protein n=1 Tax=Prunus armeniaca TaxID=36596 RepID=A0A6J5VPE4_PRUAR|nr:unnamed protein product [Prunus armeniaca]
MGKVGKQYASYTGVMARTIIPIYLSNSAAVDDHLKEKIWTEITFGIQILMASRQQAHIDKKIVAKDEEVDRSLLWKVAREDKNGKIVDEEVAELAGTIEKTRCFAARDKKDYGRTTEKARSCARTSSKANGDAKAGDFRSTL